MSVSQEAEAAAGREWDALNAEWRRGYAAGAAAERERLSCPRCGCPPDKNCEGCYCHEDNAPGAYEAGKADGAAAERARILRISADWHGPGFGGKVAEMLATDLRDTVAAPEATTPQCGQHPPCLYHSGYAAGAAAQREADAELAERTHAMCCGACSLTDRDRSHEHPPGMALREPFADLLREPS